MFKKKKKKTRKKISKNKTPNETGTNNLLDRVQSNSNKNAKLT